MSHSSPSSSSACPRPATLPWPKIPHTPAMKRCCIPVALDVLLRQEADDRLPDRQPNRAHRSLLISRLPACCLVAGIVAYGAQSITTWPTAIGQVTARTASGA